MDPKLQKKEPSMAVTIFRSAFVKRFALAVACYMGVVWGGSLIIDGLNGGPSPWIGAAIAFAALVPAAAMLWIGPWMMRHQEGLERWVLYQSVTVAFFLTMALSVGSGLLEAFAGMPPLSAWWLYSAGMLSWAVATIVLQRRSLR